MKYSVVFAHEKGYGCQIITVRSKRLTEKILTKIRECIEKGSNFPEKSIVILNLIKLS